MKPVSDWTDDELRRFMSNGSRVPIENPLAAEVLRLRAETDEWSDRMDAMYAKLTARNAVVEADLAAARAEINRLHRWVEAEATRRGEAYRSTQQEENK